MRLEPPRWWYREPPDVTARLLRPAGWLYGGLVALRLRLVRPLRVDVPVICVGNLTAGGAGKTPLALHVAQRLITFGRRPGFLTRGYGGSLTGPHRVDPDRDDARATGDEPLLLARLAPTVVARDRRRGALALRALPGAVRPDVIIMDDGLQNPTLAKDLTIAVVDGARVVGNGLVMPAGPLRGAIADQLARVQAIVVLAGGASLRPLDGFPGPILHGSITPAAGAEWLAGSRVVAYAGIGRPEKLFETLKAAGAVLAAAVPFPDHHRFAAEDAGRLIALAEAYNAALVTTEKDLARIGGDPSLAELARHSRALAIEIRLEPNDAHRLDTLLRLAVGG